MRLYAAMAGNVAGTINNTAQPHRVAIIGGGITGAIAASELCSHRKKEIRVDLFDQGRGGVGGRSSTRRAHENGVPYEWDHGCQFFRVDTDRFREIVQEWTSAGIAKEWHGRFTTDNPSANSDNDFFGLPSRPPFFIGSDGMQSIPKQLLEQWDATALEVYSGTRVSGMQRNEESKKWTLLGTGGEAAYHDTSEEVATEKERTHQVVGAEYDAVLLTDISSSFGGWHRASAGVPESFATLVRERVSARVPLFSAMVSFEQPLPVDFDAMSFRENDTIWFAARMASKLSSSENKMDCWTLISTPEYAMSQIEATPMQDPKTGEFVPQTKDYLATVPGPDLLDAFRKALFDCLRDFPDPCYVDAQRWGSALPCHRHLTEQSPTRKTISNVSYDSGRSALAPTTRFETDRLDFLVDKDLMLFQAGDMVSRYTPGFEGAALSGQDAARHIVDLL